VKARIAYNLEPSKLLDQKMKEMQQDEKVAVPLPAWTGKPGKIAVIYLLAHR
jgi:hypothetical protein